MWNIPKVQSKWWNVLHNIVSPTKYCYGYEECYGYNQKLPSYIIACQKGHSAQPECSP